MDIKLNDPESQEITRLIQEEERAALEIFRRQDFRRTVEARIRELPPKKHRCLVSWKLVVPAGAAALVFVAAGVFLFNRRPHVPYANEKSGSFLAGLRGLPGLAELATGQEIPRAGEDEIRVAPRSIQDVLALAQENQRKERERAIERPQSLKVPRLSLERKMTILFKDKAVERVLILARKKSEEV